jgi:putative ABC transport system substrate-binding protein
MKRREFITLLGGVATLPLAARAQQPKSPRIGILVLGSPDPQLFLQVFQEALRNLGYIDGQNVAFDLRSAGGDSNLLPNLAAQLTSAKVDIIVAYQTSAATAAKAATRDIPIVMTQVGDPVATGLVDGLSRPGGNITGSSGAGASVGAKNLELIRELLPAARRVAVLANATDPYAKPFLEQIQLAGRSLSLEAHGIMVHPAGELDAAFAQMETERFDAVIIQPSLLRPRVIELALEHRIPAISPLKAIAFMGGLASYAAIAEDTFRLAASYVDRILKGAKPGDLPIQQPTKFELVLNLKTAKTLGLTVPDKLLALADEVIE